MAGRVSIGELNERSLHRALKARYAPSGSKTEQSIEGYVADVVADGRVVEVHTGHFSPLRKKLACLLAKHRVTLVYPVARDRYIVKLKRGSTDPATRRMSPKHGTVFDVFSPLVSIPCLLDHPNLTIDVVMTVEEAIREVTGPSGRWRRNWTSVDRRLLEVVETHRIRSMADLFVMIDEGLPERFTTRDIAVAIKASRRLAQKAAFCLRVAGVAEVCGKDGNSLVYSRVAGAAESSGDGL